MFGMKIVEIIRLGSKGEFSQKLTKLECPSTVLEGIFTSRVDLEQEANFTVCGLTINFFPY